MRKGFYSAVCQVGCFHFEMEKDFLKKSYRHAQCKRLRKYCHLRMKQITKQSLYQLQYSWRLLLSQTFLSTNFLLSFCEFPAFTLIIPWLCSLWFCHIFLVVLSLASSLIATPSLQSSDLLSWVKFKGINWYYFSWQKKKGLLLFS